MTGKIGFGFHLAEVDELGVGGALSEVDPEKEWRRVMAWQMVPSGWVSVYQLPDVSGDLAGLA